MTKRSRRRSSRYLLLLPIFVGLALGYLLYRYSPTIFRPASINLLRDEAEDGVVITMTEHETNVTVTNEKTGKKVKVTPKPGQTVTDAIIDATKEVTKTTQPSPRLPQDPESCVSSGRGQYDWDYQTNKCVNLDAPASTTTIPTILPPQPPVPPTVPPGPSSSTSQDGCKVNDEDTVAYGDNQWVQLGNGTCRQCTL